MTVTVYGVRYLYISGKRLYIYFTQQIIQCCNLGKLRCTGLTQRQELRTRSKPLRRENSGISHGILLSGSMLRDRRM